MSDTIECIKCGKQKIMNETCSNCGYTPSKGFEPIKVILIVAGAIIFLFGVNYIFQDGNSKTPKAKKQIDNIEVYSGVKEYVKNNLKAPKTAEFPRPFEYQNHVKRIDENNFIVTSWVDSQNSYGALIRTKFTCNIRHSHGKLYGSNLVFE